MLCLASEDACRAAQVKRAAVRVFPESREPRVPGEAVPHLLVM